MKARIRQNAWGNWYGYLGTRKVKYFSSHDAVGGQAQAAHEWLAQQTGSQPAAPKRRSQRRIFSEIKNLPY